MQVYEGRRIPLIYWDPSSEDYGRTKRRGAQAYPEITPAPLSNIPSEATRVLQKRHFCECR